jgi:hypothetical protein
MATKGPPPTYTETCPHCQAVIPVRDVINIDAEHNHCPKCGEAYKVPGWKKWQQLWKLTFEVATYFFEAGAVGTKLTVRTLSPFLSSTVRNIRPYSITMLRRMRTYSRSAIRGWMPSSLINV